MNELFEKKFPTSAKYFNALFETKRKFPQSLVFEGLDIFGQYFFALEIARVLNCLKDGKADCNCANCNWIRENKHPAVITVSQIDFKEQNDGTKTVISVRQAQNITKSLAQASDFHRVFIFLDAKTGEMEEHLKEQFKVYQNIDFALPCESWVPSYLNYATLHALTPNALLKSIEEPPERTTFIFLTKNKEDLINTIVSRSMTFRLPSEKFLLNCNDIKEILVKYPDFNLKDAFKISGELQNLAKEKDLLPKEILNMLEQFLGNLMIQNPNSQKIKKDIKKIGQAKLYLQASMAPKNVFDSLMIDLAVI